jgi:hypothetical protein
MIFEYSKTRQQKKALIKEKIEQQYRLIQQQHKNAMIIDKKIKNSSVDAKEMQAPVKVNVDLFENMEPQNVVNKENKLVVSKQEINELSLKISESTQKEIKIVPLNIYNRTLLSVSQNLKIQELLINELNRINSKETCPNSGLHQSNRDYQGITLVNRYQPYYANGNASGFGDFLRGCYYLIQYCEEKNYTCEIDLSQHLLSFFLKNSGDIKITDTNITIYKFTDINADLSIENNNKIVYKVNNNYELLKTYLNDQEIVDNNLLFVYVNSFPLYPLSLLQKKKMRFFLEPSEDMVSICQEILKRIELFNQPFSIIHIRWGDEYLIENENKFDGKKLNLLKKEIDLILSSSTKYLLIADNNTIKKYIIRLYPFFKTYFKEITHFGEGIILEKEKVKNTMIDFYLMTYAQHIFSFSCYLHGSGFSKWCAETYDIPYICKYIK